MAKPFDTTPDLGVFFGDQGGPGTALPRSDAYKNCPFLDTQVGTFCSLDGAMCPFVGFNYRKCKKYINNIAKGALYNNGQVPGAGPATNTKLSGTSVGLPGGLRFEALHEGKKRGSEKAGVTPPPSTPPSTGSEVDAYLNGTLNVENLPPVKKTAASYAQGTKLPPLSADTTSSFFNTLHALTLSLEGQQLTASSSQEKIKGGVDAFITGETAKAVLRPGKPSGGKEAAERELSRTLEQLKNMKGMYRAYLKAQGLSIDEGSWADYNAMYDAFINILETDRHNSLDRTVGSAGRDARRATGEIAPDDPLVDRLYRGTGTPGTATSNVAPFPTGKGQDTADKTPNETPDPSNLIKKSTEEKPETQAQIRKRLRLKREKDARKAAEKAERERLRKEKKAAKDAAKAAKAAQAEKTPSETQASSKGLTYNQFEGRFKARLADLTSEERERIFSAPDATYKTPEAVLALAKERWEGNDKQFLAQMDSKWRATVNDILGLRSRKKAISQELDHQIEMAKKANLIDEKTLKFLREDPARLGKVAEMMNKARQRLYTLETQNVNIGDQKITKFFLQATLPTLDRSDYEVMRMSEQLGLAAIKKQHELGRGYGKFNTWNLLTKQVIMPVLLLWSGHAGYIKPLLHIWPQPFFDQLYFAYLRSPLPKLRNKSEGPQLSRDAKFEQSQKMMSPRGERIMQGYHTDPAGMVMPSDRAVLHTRSYPTTKQTWNKVRGKVLAQKYQEAKARIAGDDDWRRGFLRGRS